MAVDVRTVKTASGGTAVQAEAGHPAHYPGTLHALDRIHRHSGAH